jgi:hypothetical protein
MGIHVDPDTIANINKTIRCIEQSDDFNMADWDTCAKAHAIEAMGRGSIDPQLVPDERVAAFLGMPPGLATALFLESDWERDEVIAFLKHYRDTGAVESLPTGSAD